MYLLVAQAGPCVLCLPHLLLWRWHMTDRHTKSPGLCLSCHLPQGQLALELHCSSRLLGLPSPPCFGCSGAHFCSCVMSGNAFPPLVVPSPLLPSATAGTFEVPRWRVWVGHRFVSSAVIPSCTHTHAMQYSYGRKHCASQNPCSDVPESFLVTQ